MKNKILFMSAMLFISAVSTAQLRVDSLGAVKTFNNTAINGAEVTDSIALNIEMPSSSNGRKYGVYASFEDATLFDFGYGCKVGLLGQITPAEGTIPAMRVIPNFNHSYKFSAAVAGVASRKIGVYGATASSLPTTWAGGNYAGYFDGNVKVTGTVTATTVTTTSDSRLKENITEINDEVALNTLLSLNPVSFTFIKDSSIFNSFEEDPITHYGFVAQEVQEIFPELVYEDGNGYLSINYTEFIPFLIKSLQSQQKHIEDLQTQLEELKNAGLSIKEVNKISTKDEIVDAILYQNNPNPFSTDTKITYQLPQTVKSATLYVYNMNGSQVAEYPVLTFGAGEIIIAAQSLDAGMYLYSLIADGQVVDTKRMILTK